MKTSSHENSSSAGEEFHSQISKSSMKAVSSSSNQVAAVITPSGLGGESSDLPADSEESMATKPSRLGSALREDSQVSIANKERSAFLTNHTSYRGVHKATQSDLLSVGQVVASFKVPSRSLSLVESVRKQIWFWSITVVGKGCGLWQQRGGSYVVIPLDITV